MPMWLADPEQDGQVRGDPERHQGQQPDAVNSCLGVGVEPDREARDDPQVPSGQPTRPRRRGGSDTESSIDGRHVVYLLSIWLSARGSSTTTAVCVDRRAARASMSSPQPG